MPFRNLPGVAICRFKARDHLLHRGEAMPYVYYLKQGVVHREIVTPDGTVVVDTIKESGERSGSIVGLMIIYMKEFDGTSTDDFVAVTDCVCYRIPVEAFKEYMRQHPALLEEALSMSIGLFDKLEAMLIERQEQGAPQLTCAFLLARSAATAQGRVLPKKYNNVEIAKHIGLHRGTVQRIITVLRHEGAVARVPEGLLLCNEAAIAAYADGRRRMKYD